MIFPRRPHKLSLEQEIDIFTALAKYCVILSQWYVNEDPENLERIQKAAALLQQSLDSRVSKVDPRLRNGME